MSVWLTIPSARPPEEAEKVLKLWRQQGYKIALVVDSKEDADAKRELANTIISSPDGYRGYARSVNGLIKFLLEMNPSAEWFVCAGDDTEPDMNHTAEEIAKECREFFDLRPDMAWKDGVSISKRMHTAACMPEGYGDTFGLMQPTGDRFAGGSIDRIAGSPWIGREFARRMYGGNGPYWPEYRHMFVDEELQEVAIKMGVFWQRPDLIHLHHHFQRESTALNSNAVPRPTPAHLVEANSPEHWAKYKAIFKARQAAGFPGHQPL